MSGGLVGDVDPSVAVGIDTSGDTTSLGLAFNAYAKGSYESARRHLLRLELYSACGLTLLVKRENQLESST